MSVPFGIVKLDHVVLTSLAPEELEKFYIEVIGCTREEPGKGNRLIHLRSGTALIDIVPAEDAPTPAGRKNMEHFCLRVEPFEPTAIMAWLDQHGIEHTDVLYHYGADGRGSSIYLTDPEGNRLELKGPGR